MIEDESHEISYYRDKWKAYKTLCKLGDPHINTTDNIIMDMIDSVDTSNNGKEVSEKNTTRQTTGKMCTK